MKFSKTELKKGRGSYQPDWEVDNIWVEVKTRLTAVSVGKAITEKLFASKWSLSRIGKWTKPGDENTPAEHLPAVRLNPPGNTDWFIELLTVPESVFYLMQ